MSKTYVLVPDTYDENRYPKYTWKWEPFKFWKLSHLKSMLIFNVSKTEDEINDI